MAKAETKTVKHRCQSTAAQKCHICSGILEVIKEALPEE
jgi:hypothetical protein